MIRRCGAKPDELEVLYRARVAVFARVAAGLTGASERARAAAQVAFATVVRKRGTLRRERALEARVWGIVHVGAALVAAVEVAASSGAAFAAATGSPTGADLIPTVEVAFLRESYAAGATAQLVIFNRARDLRLRVYRSGPERVVTLSSRTLNGVPVTPSAGVGSSDGGLVEVEIGRWPSGLYFARVRADDGRIGFAPFVVRPHRLGEHRVAVVLPTQTWQAYNFRRRDTWYADWTRQAVRLVRAHLNRGVPYNFRRLDLPFLRWLARTGKEVDLLSQSDLESATSPRALAAAYDLIVFPGHHEYVTSREYDLVEGFRNLGGNLMFLASNNFFWRVERTCDLMSKTKQWRDLGRPEAALVGVQYRANGIAPTKPWVVRRSRAGRWIFAGTGLKEGSAFASGGVEIDRTTEASPAGIEIVAEVPDVFGRGLTGQMTYYKTRAGAKVFAAGAFYLIPPNRPDRVISRMLENLWARLASP